jgi:hypothetical protein
MKNKLLLTTFIFLLSPSILWAQMSAHRDPHLDSSFYVEKYFGPRKFEKSSGRSALARASLNSNDPLPAHQRWSLQELQRRFEILRDYPIVDGKWTPSWRYPEDGCFARASMANKTAFQHYFPLPGKVFAFGNLRVETENSPRGSVSWWYHVAPIVEAAGEKYVIDPAINFSRPLKLSEWLEAMGDSSQIKVSFCESGTYNPGDSCESTSDGLELSALNTQRYYLKLEASRRNRIIDE